MSFVKVNKLAEIWKRKIWSILLTKSLMDSLLWHIYYSVTKQFSWKLVYIFTFSAEIANCWISSFTKNIMFYINPSTIFQYLKQNITSNCRYMPVKESMFIVCCKINYWILEKNCCHDVFSFRNNFKHRNFQHVSQTGQSQHFNFPDTFLQHRL